MYITGYFPEIKFDQAGVCNKCQETEQKYLKRDLRKLEQALLGVFDWAKRQNKRYDCVVPFSGGKDSSYALHLCRKKYGLKVLAVNFNNGLRTPEALLNIENIVKQADVAYACYGPNWQVMKKLYREFLLKTGQFCFACDLGIWATVHWIAEQYDVPLIISGFSAQIESRGPKIYSYNNNLFRTVAQGVISDTEMGDFLEQTLTQKIFSRLKHGTIRRYRRQISLPDYIVWDDQEIKRVISDELGWQKRPDGSSDHIDCLFAPMKNYLVVQKWGFGEKTTKYSAMARTGELTRDQALKKAAQDESPDKPAVFEQFLEMLELKAGDVARAKNKSHLEYL